ncbi:MAG: nitroreductase family protein [Thermoleophilia bacterium]|jgi:nitroreductase|nr:nitroreductase family protein [Thermoleophilia bacterium]
METWDAIRARRNVRAFDGRPVAPGDLDRILEAGRRAPSSRNLQRWDFVVVTGRDALRRLAGVWIGAGPVATSAATVALIAPRSDDPREIASIHYDLGQATMAMMVAAADLGIGSGHSAVADQDLARSLLGHPPDRTLAWLIPLGYPADRPLRPLRAPARRPFTDVVHREHWRA